MPDERSLAGDPDVPNVNAHPLGTPNPDPAVVTPAVVSIVDTILDLDEFLSGDVRRAEKTARFCTKPWLEADIDELDAELDRLTDSNGNPLSGERSLGDTSRTAEQVALELQAKQAEYGAAFRSVRMLQLPSDKWAEFKTQWRAVLDAGAPYPADFYDALIAVSAKSPAMPLAKVQQLRTVVGDPQMDVLSHAAWQVNTNSGVSIPKSLLSSHVLRRAVRAQS